MNLRKYYDAVKKTRESLPEPFVYLTSEATPNGGIEGRVTEVETAVAARMIVDGIARVSEPEEIEAFLSKCASDRAKAREEELRQRVRITLVNDAGLQLESEKPEKTPRSRA